MSGEEQSDLAGRGLVKKHQESEPALISVFLSFLLHLGKMKYHCLEVGKARNCQSVNNV